MRIKTRVQISVMLSILVAGAVGLALFMAVQAVHEKTIKGAIAVEIVRGVAELKIVTHDYLLHPAKRAQMQWQSRFDSLTKLLRRKEFGRPEEKIIIDRMVHEHKRVKTVFVRLAEGFEKGPGISRSKSVLSRELQESLMGLLSVKSQMMVSDALQLDAAVQAEVEATQRKTTLVIFVFLAGLTALIVVILLRINRSVARPIAELEKGIQIIGNGRLDYKVAIAAKDEIGELSRAFDQMKSRLRSTTVSRDELAREVAERKQAEEALRRSEQRFREIAELLPNIVSEMDMNMRLTYVNNIALETFGITQDDFDAGINGMDFIHPGDKEKGTKHFERLLKGIKVGPGEYRMLRKDGSEISVLLNAAAIYKDDEIIGIRASLTDITVLRKFQEELLKTRKLEAVGTLAGGIAHDFNNLLAVILGNVTLAENDIKPEIGTSKNLKEIEKAVIRARELSKRLITFSKGGEPVKERISIGALLRDSVNSVLSGSGIDCKFSIADALLPLAADEGQIGQVIRNIATNALEALDGEGLVRVGCDNIVVQDKDSLPIKAGQYVLISVKDNGPGIPEEDLPNIFDPYFSSKEMGVQKGMGLGLAVAHSIVQKHGGLITVESEPGAGATSCIYLPALDAEGPCDIGLASQEIGKAQSAEHEPPVTQSSIRRVLVMDDEEAVRKLAGQFLERLGYASELAKDGAEAIELYKRAKETGKSFDVLVLDLTVKGAMGGKEALKKLLAIDPGVKVIVSSGYCNDPVLSNFRAYGFYGALEKPYTMDAFGKILRATIAGQHE